MRRREGQPPLGEEILILYCLLVEATFYNFVLGLKILILGPGYDSYI